MTDQPKLRNGLTAKQEHFARLVASGKTGAESYREAYDTNGHPATVDSEVVDLLAHPTVAPRIDQLREQTASYANITPESIAADLNDNREAARSFRQAAPMNQATTLRANLAGLLLPQVNVNQRSLKIEGTLGEMTPEELRALIGVGDQAQALEDGSTRTPAREGGEEGSDGG